MVIASAAGVRADSVWLINARVVDLDTGISHTRNIHVERGLINTVDATKPPQDARVVDLNNRFVLPGLVNCHTHLQGRYPYHLRDEGEDPRLTALRAAGHGSRLLDIGVTTVRCVHEQSRADLFVREAARSGWIDAPRILAAGRALTTPGGHGAGFGSIIASGADEFRNAARSELEAGADHIKVFLSGGLARTGEAIDTPELTGDELRAVVETADEGGAYVVVHAGGPASIRIGLRAGVRSFEHAYTLDDQTAAAMASEGSFLTPTLVATHASEWQRAIGFSEESIQRSALHAEAHMQSARTAIEAGVAVVVGTDIPGDGVIETGSLFVHEMRLLIAAGMSQLDVIRAATLVAADLVRLQTRIGRVAPGFEADIIAVADDPTKDIGALDAVDFVMLRGHVVERIAQMT